MSRAFTLIYETPYGTVRAEADTRRELAGMVHDEIARMLMPVSGLEGMSLDDAASAVLKAYRSAPRGRRNQKSTRLYEEGGERAAIRCYLKGLTIYQSVEWLASKKGVTVSKSSLGRFFWTLYDLGFRPLKTERKRTAVKRHTASGNGNTGTR